MTDNSPIHTLTFPSGMKIVVDTDRDEGSVGLWIYPREDSVDRNDPNQFADGMIMPKLALGMSVSHALAISEMFQEAAQEATSEQDDRHESGGPHVAESATTPMNEVRALRLIAATLNDNPDAYLMAVDELASCDNCWLGVVTELIDLIINHVAGSEENAESWRDGIAKRIAELLDAMEADSGD